MREMCAVNYVNIISGNASPDHVHMLVSVSSHLSISKIIQYIKGKISRKLQGKFQGLRKRYWRQHLWTRGYFVATSVHLSAKEVQKYIEKQ
ncbi:MAG: IS200/IS605 family transposase [Alphaproteobacteria bacterium]|nr:IS200/IS605 family transposase [Alphaproteobacteria bacterium]